MRMRRSCDRDRFSIAIFLSILVAVTGCEKKYEAPIPDTTWDQFESGLASAMTASTRKAMEGVYIVSDGSGQFGGQVALKWSYTVNNRDTLYSLSIVTGKDISYFIVQGKRYQNSLIFDGYWRKMTNVETGVSRFTISDANGAAGLINGTVPSKGQVVMDGTWGNNSDIPTQRVVFTYDRPLYAGRKMEVIAHRGGGRTSDYLPYSENSLGMIKYASKMAATGIEVDVRLTSDGVPVLYHDNTLNLRLIQKNGLVGKIEDYSYAQLLSFVRLIDGETIPTLTDALSTVIYSTNLHFVWLDTKYVGSLDVVRAVQKDALDRAHQLGRDVEIVIGLPGDDQFNHFLQLPDYTQIPALCELSVDDVRESGALIWAPRWTLGTQNDAVVQIQGEGKRAFVWTLDDPPYVEQFINQGNFDGILSNYPSVVAYYSYVRQ